MNFAWPFFFVRSVMMVVPGRGLDVDRGVDSCTGMFGAGVPRNVTSMVAAVMFGFGLKVTEGPGVGAVYVLE